MAFTPPPLFRLKPNPTAIKSLYNADQGLFPLGKYAMENNQIVTQSLNLKEENGWTPRHRGYTNDNNGMLTAFELTNEHGIPTGFFLCYSYVKKHVVLRKDCRDIWLVKANSEKTHFTIELAVEDDKERKILTFKADNEPVYITKPITDLKENEKQQWLFIRDS